MPLDVLGRTRATLIGSSSIKPWPIGLGNLLKTGRAGDRSLQLLIFNEEFLVNASHQLALITSLPFVHTARRYYRLNGLVSPLDCCVLGATLTRKWEGGQTWSFRGSKSRNKVSVGEPAEGSLTRILTLKEKKNLCEPSTSRGTSLCSCLADSLCPCHGLPKTGCRLDDKLTQRLTKRDSLKRAFITIAGFL